MIIYPLINVKKKLKQLPDIFDIIDAIKSLTFLLNRQTMYVTSMQLKNVKIIIVFKLFSFDCLLRR
jgi:hypothetical protein